MITLFKSEQKIIEEIHESFYSEVDKLLKHAKIEKYTPGPDKAVMNKAARLKNIGFSNTKTVQEATGELKSVQEVSEENRKRERLKEDILYFQEKYPLNRLITPEAVQRICKEYKLVYAPAKYYTGEIPDKNLKEIEDFGLYSSDACSIEISSYGTVSYGNYYGGKYNRKMAGFEIVAPLKDFDTKNGQINLSSKGFSFRPIKDPIVLQPVMSKTSGNMYYLIVTAWGLEASDPDVVNKINN